MYVVVVFFFKKKTAYDVRISDWIQDVCSSDLDLALPCPPAAAALQQSRRRPMRPGTLLAAAFQNGEFPRSIRRPIYCRACRPDSEPFPLSGVPTIAPS